MKNYNKKVPSDFLFDLKNPYNNYIDVECFPGFETPHDSFVQLTCAENAIAFSGGIVRILMVRLDLKARKICIQSIR